MKRIFLLLMIAVSCNVLGPEDAGTGELRLLFAGGRDVVSRTVYDVPDTGDFILTVHDSKGGVVYFGKYGACPEVLEVPSGSYTVKVLSSEFSKPAFSSPQYGDEQCVTVPAGGVAHVELLCSQVNCGIRLDVSPDFLTEYPDGVLFLKSKEGSLMYGYSERRAAYFLPGNVSLVLDEGESAQTLMTRRMNAQEMLLLKVSVAESSGSSEEGIPSAQVSVGIDTSRLWITDSYEIGGDNDAGASSEGAMTVAQARTAAGQKDVWISGYVVGGDLTSSAASFEPPFKSRTNIVIGPKSTTSARSSCMSVQLPAGDVREALNLVDNPSLLGRRILLRGDVVEAYYGIPGVKNISDYEL